MKNKTLISFIPVMLLAVCLTACSGGSQETSIEVTCDEFAEQPRVVKDLTVGEYSTFTVTLCTSATTGFLWSDEVEISDEAIISQARHEMTGKGMLDISPKETWTFQTLGAGVCTIKFKYSRPWETESIQRLWTVDLTVDVNSP